MIAIEIEKINEKILWMMDLYQKYDKEIFMVKNNDELKLYDREEIEFWEANMEKLCIWTEDEILPSFLELKKTSDHQELLANMNKLELIIKKFWYKYFWTFKAKAENKTQFIKWKNAYLDHCIKPFVTLWKDITINDDLTTEVLANNKAIISNKGGTL